VPPSVPLVDWGPPPDGFQPQSQRIAFIVMLITLLLSSGVTGYFAISFLVPRCLSRLKPAAVAVTHTPQIRGVREILLSAYSTGHPHNAPRHSRQTPGKSVATVRSRVQMPFIQSVKHVARPLKRPSSPPSNPKLPRSQAEKAEQT
jgi:hypothetical protein